MPFPIEQSDRITSEHAVPSAAIHNDVTVSREFGQTPREFVEGYVNGPGEMRGAILRCGADVEDHHVAPLSPPQQVVGGHRLGVLGSHVRAQCHGGVRPMPLSDPAQCVPEPCDVGAR